MLGRLLILIAMMLTGPLFIEVYLYHPMIVLEHDKAAMIPMVASPLVLFGGFLADGGGNRLTRHRLRSRLSCVDRHRRRSARRSMSPCIPDTLFSLLTDPNVWLGQPPILVPLSFAAAGCLGLHSAADAGAADAARAAGRHRAPARRRSPRSAALVATIAGAMVDGGTVALFAVIAALGFGAFGYIAELIVLAVPARARVSRAPERLTQVKAPVRARAMLRFSKMEHRRAPRPASHLRRRAVAGRLSPRSPSQRRPARRRRATASSCCSNSNASKACAIGSRNSTSAGSMRWCRSQHNIMDKYPEDFARMAAEGYVDRWHRCGKAVLGHAL